MDFSTGKVVVRQLVWHIVDIVDIADIADIAILQCLNRLEQDVEPAAKALALSEPMAIFHAGHGKS